MKETLKNIVNAPIVQRLRLLENKRVERFVQRRKLIQTKMNDVAEALDAKIKNDFRDQLNDINDLLKPLDGYESSVDSIDDD